MVEQAAALDELQHALRAEAARLGFAAIGFCDAEDDPLAGERLDAWLGAGHHGTMDWMAERAEVRRGPRAMWPEAGSVIALGMSYAPDPDPLGPLPPGSGRVSVYARGRDYHLTVKKAAKALARFLVTAAGARGLGEPALKVFTDTAPVMEKPLGERAGIGWQGKHTNLVSRAHGSWLFLAAIYCALPLRPDRPHRDACGSCDRCQRACPTDAFPAPYQLDARRCISYLTIEHDGPIPHEFRQAIGDRIYGCDDCLAVCPWNRFAATAARHRDFVSREGLDAPPLAELLTLDDAGFRAMFSTSPIKRIGRDRFVRNCLIAAGNSGDRALEPPVRSLLDDPDPVVAEAAEWALERLAYARPCPPRCD